MQVSQEGEEQQYSVLERQTRNCIMACDIADPNYSKDFIGRLIPFQRVEEINLKPISTLPCTTQALSSGQTLLDSQNFYVFPGNTEDEYYVVFKFEEVSPYILSDANVWKTPKKHGGYRVDDIPYAYFKALIDQGKRLIFTGFSVGGGVAILVASKLIIDFEINKEKIVCITFGAPQVIYVNQKAYNYCKEVIHRYEFRDDPVPKLLTAFQTIAENNYEEVLINLMKYLGIKSEQNYYRNLDLAQFGKRDYLMLNQQQLDEILNYSHTANTFGDDIYSTQIEIDTKILANNVNIQLDGCHTFKRYRDILFPNSRLFWNDTALYDNNCFEIPNARLFVDINTSQQKGSLNKIEAYYDEQYTKIIVTSQNPSIFSVRYAKVQNFESWNMQRPQICQDSNEFKIMIVFYSGLTYEDLNKDSELELCLLGCFNTVEQIKVEAQYLKDDAIEIKDAYKQMTLRKLFASALTRSMFLGKNHNPQLEPGKLQSCEQQETLFKNDHQNLVELLGSLVVNQKLYKIITQEAKKYYYTKWANKVQIKTQGITQQNELQEKNTKLQEEEQKLCQLAQLNIERNYQKFKYNGNLRVQKLIAQSMVTLVSLESLLVWYLKMNSNTSQDIVYKPVAAAAAAVGAAAAPIFLPVFIGIGIVSILGSALYTGYKYGQLLDEYYQTFVSEKSEQEYRGLLQKMLNNVLGYQMVMKGQSIAAVEKKIVFLFIQLLKECNKWQEFLKLEEDLDAMVLDCMIKEDILEDNQDKDSSSDVDGQTEESLFQTDAEDRLVKLIQKKIEFLCQDDIYKQSSCIATKPSRIQIALIIFIWNNYRIRVALSKKIQIMVLGQKKAGKSLLSQCLGACIKEIGQTEETQGCTIHQLQNSKFNVADNEHFDSIQGDDLAPTFYACSSDVVVIVIKSQDMGNFKSLIGCLQKIIKAMQEKQEGLGKKDQPLPILILFNQVDAMIFRNTQDSQYLESEENDEDPTDAELQVENEHLRQKFEDKKQQIFNNLSELDLNKVKCLLTALRPALPQPTEKKLEEMGQKYNLTTRQLRRTAKLGDKQRLQEITKCSFFADEAEAVTNENSVVNNLAKIIEKIFGKENGKKEADAFKAMYQNTQ